MFNHSNIKLPERWDSILRLFVVTPDMHRVHHSVFPNETNSNFGFNSPWWDRLLGTYRPQPRLGHEAMTIGLNQFRDPNRLTLPKILVHSRFSVIPELTRLTAGAKYLLNLNNYVFSIKKLTRE